MIGVESSDFSQLTHHQEVDNGHPSIMLGFSKREQKSWLVCSVVPTIQPASPIKAIARAVESSDELCPLQRWIA